MGQSALPEAIHDNVRKQGYDGRVKALPISRELKNSLECVI